MRHLVPLLLVSACATHTATPIEQTTTTHVRSQQALVLPPEVPMGLGAPLAPGMASLTAMAGLTGTQAVGGVGQTALPLTGGVRGSTAAARGVEVTASGTVGSPQLEAGPLSTAMERPEKVLGRGAIGLRGFVPTRSALDVGLSLDVGAEASSNARTDTITVTHRDRSGTTDSDRSDTVYELHVRPHVRTAFLLRAPLAGLPVDVVGGAQLQNWTVYWDEATHTETCTRYAGQAATCETRGSIPSRPGRQVAIATPTAGVNLKTDTFTVHAQGFVHLGPDGVDTVPWGAMVGIELFRRPPSAAAVASR